MRGEDRVVLVGTSDDNFAMHMGVMVYSVLKNKRKGCKIDFYAFDGGIRSDNKRRFENVFKKAGKDYDRLAWVRCKGSELNNLSCSRHLSRASYLRLLIPRYLPDNVDRAIYIDSDVVVEGDIGELWSEDIEGVPLAAVRDPVLPRMDSRGGVPDHQKLGVDPSTPYFNAGVMLINVAYWRAHEIHERALEYARQQKGKLRFDDQDSLNVVVGGNWKQLPRCWNVFALKALEENNINISTLPEVIHFTTSRKPWNFNEKGYPWRGRYMGYLKGSGWFESEYEWRAWRRREFVRYMRASASNFMKVSRRAASDIMTNRMRGAIEGVIDRT